MYQGSTLGDYQKYGNDSNVYKNIMDNNGQFLYKYSDGHWRVCTNYQYSLLQNRAILFLFQYVQYHVLSLIIVG